MPPDYKFLEKASDWPSLAQVVHSGPIISARGSRINKPHYPRLAVEEDLIIRERAIAS